MDASDGKERSRIERESEERTRDVNTLSGASAGLVTMGKLQLFRISDKNSRPYRFAASSTVYSGSERASLSETPKSEKRITLFILASVYFDCMTLAEIRHRCAKPLLLGIFSR